MNGTEIADAAPVIIWSANRDQPVGESSTLSFSVGGDLVLKDSNGKPIWSTNTSPSDPSVIGMSFREGNLMLLNKTNGTVWQSVDHPTDTLLLGQIFNKGQQLTSSKSSVDISSGLFYVSADSVGFSAYIVGKNSSLYLTLYPDLSYYKVKTLGNLTHIEYEKGSIYYYYPGYEGSKQNMPSTEIPTSPYIQLLRLDVDGGLRLHDWKPKKGWKARNFFFEECQFPLKCGRYGVCRNRKQKCTCPVAADGTHFFAPSDSDDAQYASHGCHQVNDSALQGGTNYQYQLQNFGNLSYFSYVYGKGATPGLESEESCKQACLRRNASCMAAFFVYLKHDAKAYCYLVSEVLSIIGNHMDPDSYYTSAHIKVKVKISSTPPRPVSNPAATSSSKFRTVMSIALATCACLFLCIFVSLLLVKRKKNLRDKLYLQRLSEILLRFSYCELSIATQNFSQKLGGGGFGLVFRGTLTDGRVVAVKRLRNDGQGKKEFLAEVETVGKIHHINLIKLVGFCAENKHLILVYEYMSNGSLEKWIFHASLDWEVRKKIVLDVAKGLAYIHEECRQRIAHLDIKPHNILLDDNFNAKISDFGMSKLINRDDSQVVTQMRGTLGYLAPEWQKSRITVKADVYSFGILLLEVISGRKILDYSQPDSDVHLLKLLEKKCLENRSIDIVDSRFENMMSICGDVLQKIELAMWCLHSDYKRRPAMSSVVKVLEGSLELESNITYNFSLLFSPVA